MENMSTTERPAHDCHAAAEEPICRVLGDVYGCLDCGYARVSDSSSSGSDRRKEGE